MAIVSDNVRHLPIKVGVCAALAFALSLGMACGRCGTKLRQEGSIERAEHIPPSATGEGKDALVGHGGGEGVLEGVVLDRMGRGVPGVRIIVRTDEEHRSRRDEAFWIDGGELGIYLGTLPFPNEVLDGGDSCSATHRLATDETVAGVCVSQHPGLREPVAEGVTSREGTFQFRGLPEIPLRAVFMPPQPLCEREIPVNLEGGGGRTGLRVVLIEGGTLRGKVLSPDGGPVADAIVEVSGAVSRRVSTDSEGEYTVGSLCGPVTLRARRGNQQSVPVPVRVHDSDEKRVDLILAAPGHCLHGWVLDHRGRPATLLRVVVRGKEGKESSGSTGDRGEFRICGLSDTERYRLEVRSESYAWVRREDVSATSEVEIRIPPAGSLRGIVRDARFGPVLTQYEAELVPHDPFVVAPPIVRQGARFEARPLAAGLWRLSVRAPGYMPYDQQVEVTGAAVPGTLSFHEVVVTLVRAGGLIGEVMNERGEPLRDVTISVAGVTLKSNTDGKFVFKELPAGDHFLEATLDGYEPTKVPIRVHGGEVVRGVTVRLRRR